MIFEKNQYGSYIKDSIANNSVILLKGICVNTKQFGHNEY